MSTSNTTSPDECAPHLRLHCAHKGYAPAVTKKLQQATLKCRQDFLSILFRQHRNELVSTLQRLFGNDPLEPDEITQIAFSQIAGMKSIDHIEDPKKFLFKTAINVGRRSLGQITKRRKYLDQERLHLESKVEEIDPERLYIGKQQLIKVNNAFKRLTQKQQEIIVRSRLMGQTYAEISSSTGWSQAAISRQINAALEQLAQARDR